MDGEHSSINVPVAAFLVKPEREYYRETERRGICECQPDLAATDLSGHFQTMVFSLSDDASSNFPAFCS